MRQHHRFQRGILTRTFLPKFMPHHQQGTLDGACGFYCVSMILDYFEMCDPNEDVGDRRTNISRLLKHLSQNQPLLEKGLHVKELKAVLDFFPKTPLSFKQKLGNELDRLLKFIQGRIRRDIPTIVAYSGGNYQHFAVTVGADREAIYLMDPAENWFDGMVYNDLLKLYRYGGRLRAKDSSGAEVEVGPCIAFWPKGWKLRRKRRPAKSSG